MTPDLRLVETASDGSDVGTVVRLSESLRDLTQRAGTAKATAAVTRSSEMIAQLDAVIGEADSVTASVDFPDVVATVKAAKRLARPEEIKRQLQILIGSFPNSAKQDLSIFGVALLEDVVAEQPGIAALTNACRRLRRKANFVPTIAEVLDALTRETQRADAQFESIRDYGERLQRAKEAAAEVRQHIAKYFERSVQLGISRLRNSDNCAWLSEEVQAEARKRIAATAVDDATAKANRDRLAPLLALQGAPKKESGWNP